MSVKTINLIPCSCSGQPEIKTVGDNKQYFVCICSKCGMTPVHFNEAQAIRYEAIKVWNRRIYNG